MACDKGYNWWLKILLDKSAADGRGGGVLRAAVEVTKEDVRALYVVVGGEDTRHVETEMNPSRLQVTAAAVS